MKNEEAILFISETKIEEKKYKELEKNPILQTKSNKIP
jgi:hypothetical protein